MSLFEVLRDELSLFLPMILSPEARAASVELTGTQVTVRVYLHGGGGIARWEALDAVIAPLVRTELPPDDSWRIVVQAVRRDRPQPLDVFGTVVWAEEGTVIASLDGKPVVGRRTTIDAGAGGRA